MVEKEARRSAEIKRIKIMHICIAFPVLCLQIDHRRRPL